MQFHNKEVASPRQKPHWPPGGDRTARAATIGIASHYPAPARGRQSEPALVLVPADVLPTFRIALMRSIPSSAISSSKLNAGIVTNTLQQ
jgi:hypothetical protein